ncbi:MAG: hypothetical protein CVT67_11085, partial [Actinobacteria bacterium HGW-Actinobacteria-7]
MNGLRPRGSRSHFGARIGKSTLALYAVAVLCLACVTAFSSAGAAAAKSDNGRSDKPPVAIIGGEANAYAGVPDRLDGSNSHDDNGIVKYEWDLDYNGSWDLVSTSPVVPYTFWSEATRDVRLRVTNRSGLTSTDWRKFHIRRDTIDPIAIFRCPTNALVGESVTLDARLSFDPFGTIKTYSWDFESDGVIDAVSTSPSIQHAWAEAGSYRVKLIVADYSGNTGSAQSGIIIEGTSDATPEPPVGLVAADKIGDNGGAVLLTWSASTESDVVGYNVYRSMQPDAGFAAVTRATTATYVDAGLANGTVYYYRITAVDAAGQESVPGATVSATPVDDTAPAAPAGVAAQDVPGDQGDAIKVTWTANAESDLAGYRLTATNVSSGASQVIQVLAPASTKTVTGLTVSQAYRFTLVAYDMAGNTSAASVAVQATPADQLAPEAPTGLVAFDREGDEGQAVIVRWAPNSEGDLAAYTLYRAVVPAGVDPLDASALALPVANFGTSVTEWTDESVLLGTQYCYYVVASDASGNVSGASGLAVVQPLDNVAPAAPMGVEATDMAPDQGGVVHVTWLGSMSADVAGYRVTVATDEGIVVSTHDVGMANEFMANGLAVGVDHTFSVVAFDGADNVSAAAEAVACGADELAPATPSGFDAVDVVPDEGGAIVVSWDANDESDLNGYTLNMFDGSGASMGTFDMGFATSKLFEGLDLAQSYSFEVAARDIHTNNSELSARVSASAKDEVAPGVVTLDAADHPQDQGGAVDLSWSAATASDVAGYKVYRDNAEIADVPGTSFTDVDAHNTAWTYTVAAYDGSLNLGELSNAVAITAVDNLAPQTPAAVAAADLPDDEGGVIEVSFAGVPDEDVDGYRVFCYDALGTLVSTAEAAALDRSVRFDQLTDGLPYSFTVLAFDEAQNLSELSAPVFGTSADNLAPVVPADLTATDVSPDQGGTILVSWTANIEGDLAGYTLTAYDAQGDVAGIYAMGLATSKQLDELAVDATYSFELTANDTAGNTSAPTSRVSATAADEIAPAAVTVTAVDHPADQGGAIDISWTASPETDVVGYKVFRDGLEVKELAVESWTDTDAGTDAHTYAVQAFDGSGNGSAASNDAVATAADNLAPAAPAVVSALDVPADEGGAIAVTISQVADADLAGYRVFCADSNGDVVNSVQVLPADSLVVFENLTDGDTYSFTALAFDTSGNESQKSDAVTASSADNLAPAVPAGLTAADRPDDEGGSVVLNWSANTESDLAGYTLLRAALAEGDDAATAVCLPLASLPVSTVTYIDETAAAGIDYVYYLVAFDGSSNISDGSNRATTRSLDNNAPSGPMAVTATDIAPDQGGMPRNTLTEASGRVLFTSGSMTRRVPYHMVLNAASDTKALWAKLCLPPGPGSESVLVPTFGTSSHGLPIVSAFELATQKPASIDPESALSMGDILAVGITSDA